MSYGLFGVDFLSVLLHTNTPRLQELPSSKQHRSSTGNVCRTVVDRNWTSFFHKCNGKPLFSMFASQIQAIRRFNSPIHADLTIHFLPVARFCVGSCRN